MLSWMFHHDYLDTYCFDCLISRVSNQNGVSLLCIMLEMHHSGWEFSICMCLVFLYLHLFSTVEHVSHGKALWKYTHYYYYYCCCC